MIDHLTSVVEAHGWFTTIAAMMILLVTLALVANKLNPACDEDKEFAPAKLPDQCGLYDDGIVYVQKPPPSRWRQSKATSDQKIRFRALLARIFSVESVIGQRVDFDPNDVIEVAIEAQKCLASEPQLIEDIEAPVTVIGDLHGQLHDLNRIFMMYGEDGKPGYESGERFLFLGDYVDRGRQSLEVVMALFILKILYPDNFFLLRGNHEFASTNLTGGFGKECKMRFAVEAAKMVYCTINMAFCWLSLTAILGGKVYCAHAGISTWGFNLRNLRNLRKPIMETNENYLVHDLVWSDPADGLTGTCFNLDRHSSIHFGRDEFAYAMHKIGCAYMLRGHSMMSNGSQCTWHRIYTIFSCSDMGMNMNKGSFARVAADLSLTIYIMPVDMIRARIERNVMGKKDDDITVCDGDGEGQIPQIKP